MGTVSNVLNRPGAVRPATRARVEAAIAELGFVPNASARQLVAGQSRMIAYVVIDASNPFFNDVAAGIEEATGPEELSLFICNSDQQPEREDQYLARLTELRPHGVLITALDYGNPRLRTLRGLDVPIVFVDRAPGDTGEWCSVGVDDVAGGAMAVEHLLELGHRRLAFVGGPTTVPQVADRLQGASTAVGASGHTSYDLVHLTTTATTIAEGRRASERLLGLPQASRPTGVFCANDLLALGMLQGLILAGVGVPDAVAVIGYDDIEFARAATVPLSSVSQPRRLLGRTGGELLLEESRDNGHIHRHLSFLPELVARESTLGRRNRD
jgi:LacI family transcriptional regulator